MPPGETPAPLRLAFMGTPDFAVPALDALLAAGHEIAAVYSQPPRPAGRGRQPRPGPVHRAALAHDLPVRTPETLKTPEALADWQALDVDAAVVVAYGLLLPEAFLDAPRLGCLNIHASLLPRWRGAAPIHRAILAGDSETGVSIMQMEPGLDTGPVIATQRIALMPDMTTAKLHDVLAEMGANLVVEALAGLAAGSAPPEPQAEEGVTYAAKVQKSEARIDWHHSATEIDRQVRALTPFPGAWFPLGDKRVKVLAGEPVAEDGGPAGHVLQTEPLTIACGTGSYRPTLLQREGKAAMPVDAFLRGTKLIAGQELG